MTYEDIEEIEVRKGKVKSASFGLFHRQIDMLDTLLKKGKIVSKSEFVRVAVDIYSVIFKNMTEASKVLKQLPLNNYIEIEDKIYKKLGETI